MPQTCPGPDCPCRRPAPPVYYMRVPLSRTVTCEVRLTGGPITRKVIRLFRAHMVLTADGLAEALDADEADAATPAGGER